MDEADTDTSGAPKEATPRSLINTNDEIIAQAFGDNYYSQLFQRNEALNIMHFGNVLLDLMQRLEDETTVWLEQPIEISEIGTAIDELKIMEIARA